jgi:thymidylate synthase
MVKHPEYQYLDLLQEILDHGFRKVDRGTGDASYSLFGKQIRFDLSQGFPLLTTKRVYWKGVLQELYWFMSGQTNIKYLVDQNVHIWDDYPYKIYKIRNPKIEIRKEEFIEKIKTDNKFAEKWGNLPRIYGEMWRAWPTKTKRTIDQLKWAVNEVMEDPIVIMLLLIPGIRNISIPWLWKRRLHIFRFVITCIRSMSLTENCLCTFINAQPIFSWACLLYCFICFVDNYFGQSDRLSTWRFCSYLW